MSNRSSLRNENGQTMAEFALVLPIILLLLFAVIQFGITFNNYLALTDAVRAGARKGTVSRQEPDPVGTTQAAVSAAAVDLDESQLKNVTVSSTWEPGSDVTVSAQYPYSISLLGIVAKSGDLTSTTTERVE